MNASELYRKRIVVDLTLLDQCREEIVPHSVRIEATKRPLPRRAGLKSSRPSAACKELDA